MANELTAFPEFARRLDMQSMETLHNVGCVGTLKRRFGARDSTLVYGEVPISGSMGVRLGIRVPNLVISFDCDPARVKDQWGYAVDEQGKPPDFALELATKTAGVVDYSEKRADYERWGVSEYWRFDADGGAWLGAAMLGDRLVDGRYKPIAIESVGDGRSYGWSDALGLYVCWVKGTLRWYDPVAEMYLRTFDEEAERADKAETLVAGNAAALAQEGLVDMENGEAYIRQVIEESGGFQAFGKQLDDYRECQIRLDKARAALTEEYPDMWVAVGKEGVVAVSASHLGLLADIDGRGISRSAVAIARLYTDPPLLLPG